MECNSFREMHKTDQIFFCTLEKRADWESRKHMFRVTMEIWLKQGHLFN